MNEYTDYLTMLSTEFRRYLMENEQFADRISENALIIFQTEGENAFNEWHETLSLMNREPDQPVTYVRMRKLRRRSLLGEVIVSSAGREEVSLPYV